MLFEEITLEEYGDIREADGIKLGKAEGEKLGVAKGIISLMKNENWSIEKAMNAMGIPSSERAEYEKMVNIIISDPS